MSAPVEAGAPADTRLDALKRWAESCLTSIFARPAMWGTAESIEAQVLLLLAVWRCAGGRTARPNFLRDEWRRWERAIAGPRLGCAPLWCLWEKETSDYVDLSERLAAVLADFAATIMSDSA